MTLNQQTIDLYMDGFRRSDRTQILGCLTEDVEWEIPGVFHIYGKDAFATHIVDDGFSGNPKITLQRMIEEGDTVVVEGAVVTPKNDGSQVSLVFCDVFDMRFGKIKRLISYLMEVK